MTLLLNTSSHIRAAAKVLPVVGVLLAGILMKPSSTLANTELERYLSPIEMALSLDGSKLYVICEGTNEVRIVDTSSRTLTARVPVGRQPRGIALSPDGTRLYVSNSTDDTVTEIDTVTLVAVRTLPTGFEPTGVITDRSGKTLYVANRLSDDISVIDLTSGQETKRLLAGHGASYLVISPDGKQIYCTHIYPNQGRYRTQPRSEITVIDTARQVVIERKQLHNVAGVFHGAISADGRLDVVAQLRPKNLIPLAHVEHGSVFGDSLTLFGSDIGGIVQIPLDELDRYYALPWGVIIAPDKSKIFVTTAGADSVTVIDIQQLQKSLRSHRQSFVNDLSASADYVVGRIPVGANPRGMVISNDGKRLYVANRLDDSISVIDTAGSRVTQTIDLGGPRTINALRRGERLFYSAGKSFQGQFGCANCHIDATIDGLEWDLEPDGFGKDIVDNRLLEDLAGTEPFKWNGGNPDLPTECGPRTEKFFFRSQSFNQNQLTDLVTFVFSLPYRRNRYRLLNGELTPAQERGKTVFERTKYKDGRTIPQTNRCAYCHSGSKYTNRQQFDVGTGKSTDRSPLIDVPQLMNVVDSPPYLHDGSARSLEEIWTVFNSKDTHGVSNDLTKDELNDLIEYLKTL
ncbi:MAG TPA: beta-propeller fold lactonase family protein [Terriglobales bacterium]|jgi:YVTN family beta-propeller protein